MCSVRFSQKPDIHDKREKKQNFMTKPSQYPEKYTLPMRHIHICVARLDDLAVEKWPIISRSDATLW